MVLSPTTHKRVSCLCGDLDVITAALGVPSDCLEEQILGDPLKSNLFCVQLSFVM